MALGLSGVALLVALGTSAWAAATVGSADIVDNSVRSRDVKNGGLRGVDVKPGSIGSTRLAANSVGDRELQVVPAVRLQRTIGNQTIATGFSGTVVDYTYGALNTVNTMWPGNGGVVTAPRDGIYVATGSVYWLNWNGVIGLSLERVSGATTTSLDSVATTPDAASSSEAQQVTSIVDMAEGDQLQMRATQLSGVSRSLFSSRLSVTWIGPAT